MKVVHLTSAHSRYDTRIFVKMCTSLSLYGYEVTLIVADGEGEEVKNNVTIIDIGKKVGGRLSRITKTVKLVHRKALEIDADLYHLHDPELMPIGIKLKKIGKKVVFDAHEDLPVQMLAKPYLNKYGRFFLSKLLRFYEKRTCYRFDAIVAATPYIRDKFLTINNRTIDVNNYPMLDEFKNISKWNDRYDEVVYVGGLEKARGIKEMVESMRYLEGLRLNLAGKFNDNDFRDEVIKYHEWSKINELGFINRKKIKKLLGRSKVGLVTLHPILNYIDALPVKMFEYMAACIPVIASDFPLWKEIIYKNNCGLCVNPLDPEAIAKAVNFLKNNPRKAEQMGRNGRKAIENKFNWNIEEKKLFDLYNELFL